MSVTIKPEIYVSINKGELITIKPEIYVSFIPTEQGLESINIDTKRFFSIGENLSIDTKRTLPNAETANIDTKRTLPNSEEVNADTKRNFVTLEEVNIDTKRALPNAETFSADTRRTLPSVEEINVDTKRTLTHTVEETLSIDTKRTVYEQSVSFVDTRRGFAQSVEIDFDLCRDFYKDVEMFFDLARNCIVVEIVDCDLVRKFPALVEASDVVSIAIQIREQTVSDEVTLEITGDNKKWPGDVVKGDFLDYHYEMGVNSTSEEYGGQVQTVQITNEVFDVAQKKVGYSLQTDEDDPGTIANHAARIATLYGYSTAANYTGNYTLQKDYSTSSQMTYREAIQEVIGWSSRVPWRMINAIVRGGSVTYIQRGMEPNIIDLDTLDYTRPRIERSLWKSDNDGSADDNVRIYRLLGYGDIEPFWSEFEPATWKNRSFRDGNSRVDYDTDEAGRPVRTEIRNPDGSSTVIEYEYIKENRRLVKTIERQTKTDKNGNSETTEVYKTAIAPYKTITNSYSDSDNGGIADSGHNIGTTEDSEHGDRWTFHAPRAINFVYGVYDIRGQKLEEVKLPAVEKYIKASISGRFPTVITLPIQGAPPFTEKVEGVPENLTLDDAGEILAHANSVQETLTLDIVTPVENGEPKYKHVIDFRDAFLFKGNMYHLVSNSVSVTPTEYRQSLTLTRWI